MNTATELPLQNSFPSVPGFERDAWGKPVVGLDPVSLYAYGHLIRQTETLILDLFSRGLVSGTTHTCIGQELCQMAVVRALDHRDDVVLSNHRNHGHFLTYSGHFDGLLGEIMGREGGVCRGYGGSQHLAYRNFHSNGVQAGMTGIGVGQALALRMRGSDGVVCAIVGDGTLGEGLLYESMNLASIWSLSVIFVVENNGIAQTTPTSTTIGGGDVEARGQAFGLMTLTADDADPAFCRDVSEFVARVRAEKRPGLLVIETRRLGPHSKGDDLRAEAEKRAIAERDPLTHLGALIPEVDRQRIETLNMEFLGRMEAAAIGSPESTFDVLPTHGFVSHGAASDGFVSAPGVNVRTSLNAALGYLLRTSNDVVLLGEDLHEPYGGAFKVTAGLSSAFPERVLSTPISEAGITGAGIGLALAGKRAIVEIMFADFVTLCADQLYNHAVKFPGMFEGCSIPLVIRTPCGGRRGYGPTHSQSPENLLVSIPGLTVVYPSNRHDSGRLLASAVTNWPNPTVFLEHKLLYSETQGQDEYVEVPADDGDHGAHLFPTLANGPADADVTVIAFGGMVPVAEKAAARLRDEEELVVRVVVPSLLSPLPRETLVDALIASPMVVVVEESQHHFGVAAEILATLAECGYSGIASRIGAQPVPIAAARSLEKVQLVDDSAIVDHVLELI